LIPLLVDIVSKNGNLLLSIPLPGHGEPDSDEIAFLDELAQWQEINSEAIKGTRPWKIFGEGPSTEIRTSPHISFPNTNSITRTLRFTTKGDVLYAFALGWPSDNRVLIKSLASAAPYYERQIRKVQLLGRRARSVGRGGRMDSVSRFRMIRPVITPIASRYCGMMTAMGWMPTMERCRQFNALL